MHHFKTVYFCQSKKGIWYSSYSLPGSFAAAGRVWSDRPRIIGVHFNYLTPIEKILVFLSAYSTDPRTFELTFNPDQAGPGFDLYFRGYSRINF